MFTEAADHHKKSAYHHELAAYHHKQAAKYHQAGQHEKALYHARLAQEHHIHATHHATEGGPCGSSTPLAENAMDNGRGFARCSSCEKKFYKLDLTSRGQCQLCAKASALHKFG